MIIYQLEMYNFRQFVGKQIIEFSTDKDKNVTVFLGTNTSGKTTLIRAFEWCLYGKNDFEDIVLLNSDIRNNMQVGDIQDTWVAVKFSHNDKVYTIKRKFTYVCNARTADPENGKIYVGLNKKPEEDLSLNFLLPDGQTKAPIDKFNVVETMDRVLPRDLSDYFFFGGERISGIANRTDLSKSVRGLMRLDVLENARDHLSKVTKMFTSLIDTSGDAYAQKMKDALATYKVKKSKLEEEKINYNNEVAYWFEKKRNYEAELSKSNVEEVKKAQNERDRIESTLKSNKERLAELKKSMVLHFNDKPIAFFGKTAILKSLQILECAKDTTESVPGIEQEAVDFLINRKCCICGTDLSEGTAPYKKIMEERRKMPPEYIGAVVNTYKEKAQDFIEHSDSYYNILANDYKDIRFVKRTIGNLKDELHAKSALILDDTEAKKIECNRKEASIKLSEARSDYDFCLQSIGQCESSINNAETAIEKYARNSKKNKKISRCIAYSEAVLNWVSDSYCKKEEIVRKELTERVNENFKKMYHGNRTIEIDDKYRVGYSDIVTDESDGLKAVKSFAFIASLVSMAKDKILDDAEMKLGQVYPLVMDAPFSNVDEIHIQNICEILPHTANQVILAVMQKDWEYASPELAKYVGKEYQILKDIDCDGKEIETSTHIK